MISPLSASIALSMAADGADGVTLEEMKRVLGFDSKTITEMELYYKSLLKNIVRSDKGVQIDIANSIWINDNIVVKRPYLKRVKKNFFAQASLLDFSSIQSVNKINNWCSENTNGKIVSIIDEINPQMVMILINALYFKGEWETPFDPKLTKTKMFHNINNSVSNVEMMHLNTDCLYYSDNKMSMIELPYGNGNFVMDIILPNSDENIETILNEMNYDTFAENLSKMNSSKVEIMLPKFKLDYEIMMNDYLQSLGINNAFTSLANFSNMTNERLMIGVVKQKTFIEVNEKGSEAAAVTMVGMMKTSLDPQGPKHFYVDRPFSFSIRDKGTNTILFIGKVLNLK